MFKYIMLSDGNSDFPIIFPKIMVHSEVASATRKILRHTRGNSLEVVSAGFVSIKPSDNIMGFWFVCHGESETLQLKSRPEDSAIVTNNPWCHGIKDSAHIIFE
jgi:hypothetical protein